MNRRGFLLGIGGILLAAKAPAIVRADSLMRIVPINTTIVPARPWPPMEVGRWEGMRYHESGAEQIDLVSGEERSVTIFETFYRAPMGELLVAHVAVPTPKGGAWKRGDRVRIADLPEGSQFLSLRAHLGRDLPFVIRPNRDGDCSLVAIAGSLE